MIHNAVSEVYIMKKNAVLAIALLALTIMISSFAKAEELESRGLDQKPIAIEVTTDKMTYQFGEAIHVHYKVTGGTGNYYDMRYYWDTHYDDNYTEEPNSGWTDLNEIEGDIYFTPTISNSVNFHIHAVDRSGLVGNDSIYDIRITGIQMSPIRIALSINKKVFRFNEEIHVHYKITGGSGNYYDTRYCLTTQYNDNYTQEPIGNKWIDLSASEGDIYFTPTISNRVTFDLHTEDRVGFVGNNSIHDIIIKGVQIAPVKISLKADKMKYLYGDAIHVHYKITGGSGNYYDMRYYWDTHFKDNYAEEPNSGWTELTESEGDIYFTPTISDRVNLSMHAQDRMGLSGNELLNDIKIISLDFPVHLHKLYPYAFRHGRFRRVICSSNMEKIPEYAFADCEDLRMIMVPSAETEIDPHAFDGCKKTMIIRAPNPSRVRTFALENGFQYEEY